MSATISAPRRAGATGSAFWVGALGGRADGTLATGVSLAAGGLVADGLAADGFAAGGLAGATLVEGGTLAASSLRNNGAGCCPVCMNRTLVRIAPPKMIATQLPTASRKFHPIAASTRHRDVARSLSTGLAAPLPGRTVLCTELHPSFRVHAGRSNDRGNRR